ncbi:MAG TPA: tannase/feruloyl esterase family alpha/beta hydrolase [Terriglobia bacterium]|nr:tannase/feruloyl esterase family alpha/beta hydrolase [Terriglobia bacterium]
MLLILFFSASPALAATCESLATLKLPQTTITTAQPVGAGAFIPPAGNGATFKNLPAFCRVAATLKPSSDSDIKIEVWMPADGWNGRLQSVGNGAWAGTISYPAMATALAAGYATASTDTGHTGNNANFIPGHPEKVIDFSYRAVHEMTVAAKAIIGAHYGNGPQFSYWNGCSTGGRQALTTAQRFPLDYDGILAGAPANYTTRLQGAQVWSAQTVHKDEAGYIPPAKYTAIHAAVLQQCDALDGVKDHVLEDPTHCKFDPSVLACKEGDGPSCLTAPQVDAARKLYAGPKDSRTGQQLFPGLAPGSEMGWATLAGPQPMTLATDVYKYLVFQNPDWDFKTLNPDTDFPLATKVTGATMDMIDPNLKPFVDHGGKLLMYHGWSDPGIPPESTVQYYKSVADKMGGTSKITNSIRLFMIPGMNHCRGGDGTDTFDGIGALSQWVEKAKAPGQIVASHMTNGKADRTRPLCPYPQIATYKGTGSTDEASNFVCK